VPEFTPPELQGINLSTVTRTVTHDGFGLAVLIFQLLFMGRHPFAGSPIKGGEHQLADWIKGFRFAYSPQQNVTLMRPPPAVPTLVDLPQALALAFQHAFERQFVLNRPTASEWASLLQSGAHEITMCRANPAHFHYRAAANCPWCRMKQELAGLVLFIPASTVVFASIDISGLAAALKAIVDPGPAPDPASTVASPTHLRLSVEALQAASVRRWHLAALASGLGIGILLTWLHRPLTLVGVAVIAGCGLIFKRLPDVTAKLHSRKKTADDNWQAIMRKWHSEAGNQKFLNECDQAARVVNDLASLPKKEQRLLNELNQRKREIQLIHFLENYRIDKAKIARIGASRRLQLASYGIETAADVDKNRLLSVPGFGPAIAGELVSWRKSLEARFSFNPSIGTDPKEIARIKGQIAGEKSTKVGEARRLINGLNQTVAAIKAKRRSMQGALQASYRALKQSEHDLSAVSGIKDKRPAAAVLVGFLLLGFVLDPLIKAVSTPTSDVRKESKYDFR
jgi:DNA-binding helix-hairpin-helix protein with protein kinase domain